MEQVAEVTLTQEQIDEYVNNSITINKLEKRQKEARVAIIAALKAGEVCPDNQPYIVELGHQSRCVEEWSDVVQEILANLGPATREKIQTLINRLREGRIEIPQLSVKVNPKWVERNQQGKVA